MVQLVKGELAHHLAKSGANFLARFAFTPLNLSGGQASSRKNHSPQTLQSQLKLLQRFATCFVIRYWVSQKENARRLI